MSTDTWSWWWPTEKFLLFLWLHRYKTNYLFILTFEENDLIYLDPHISRPSVGEALTAEATETYRGDSVKRMPITAIDPCFVAAFLLQSEADYITFVSFINDLKDPSGFALVSINDGPRDVELVDCVDDSDFVDVM